MENMFLFTFISVKNGSSSSVIYPSFDEAMKHFNSEFDRLTIYDGTSATKKIGIYKKKVKARINSKYISVILEITQLEKDDNNYLSTDVWDYDHEGIAI